MTTLIQPDQINDVTPYKLSVTVSTNNLVVALKDKDGNDPSSSSPVKIRIGDTIRSITSALSITITAGTNYFNAGASHLATYAVPYFVYLVWDSNSSAVALTIARRSHYRIVDTTMATTTSDRHIFNYANFTAGDDMANIGYFEATNSGSASYNWSVPTFTNKNLHYEPTFDSNRMTYGPTYSASGSMTFTGVTTTYAYYRIVFGGCSVNLRATGTLGGTASNFIYADSPIDSVDTEGYILVGSTRDSGSGALTIGVGGISTSNLLYSARYDAANYSLGASRYMGVSGRYEI